MRPVSGRFLSTLRGSHKVVFRAKVLTSYQSVVDPTGIEIPIVSGDVQSSSATAIRSTLNLTTSFKWPQEAMDLLAPYGNEITVARGISYGDGQSEMVPLGIFRIETVEQDDVPVGAISITASDRMAAISDARFLSPRQFPANATRGQVVDALIKEVYPLAVIQWDDTALRDGFIGRSIIAERDRDKILTDLVTSMGKIGYFDHRGIFVIRTPASLDSTPSWTVDAGRNGVLVSMARSITREGIYNVVVASGEATDSTPPITAMVADLSRTSPTYYRGRFGPVPRFYTSPFITNSFQARDAAAVLLRKSLGLPYQVNLSSIANPALEADDVISLSHPSATSPGSLRTEAHVLDTVTIPLEASSPVELTTRKQYGVEVGDVTE